VNRPEQATVTAQIAALQRMTVGELREEWKRLYPGEVSRSFNKQFLWRRLAWRVQELAYGGLSERAKARIAELNRDDDLRFLPPRGPGIRLRSRPQHQRRATVRALCGTRVFPPPAA